MKDTDLARQHVILETVTRVAHHIDAREWAALRSLYADEVETVCFELFQRWGQRRT